MLWNRLHSCARSKSTSYVVVLTAITFWSNLTQDHQRRRIIEFIFPIEIHFGSSKTWGSSNSFGSWKSRVSIEMTFRSKTLGVIKIFLTIEDLGIPLDPQFPPDQQDPSGPRAHQIILKISWEHPENILRTSWEHPENILRKSENIWEQEKMSIYLNSSKENEAKPKSK